MRNFFSSIKTTIYIKGKNFKIIKFGIYKDKAETFCPAQFFSSNCKENNAAVREVFILSL